jgi:hypothetical protein
VPELTFVIRYPAFDESLEHACSSASEGAASDRMLQDPFSATKPEWDASALVMNRSST